jgi:hypothetical protein
MYLFIHLNNFKTSKLVCTVTTLRTEQVKTWQAHTFFSSCWNQSGTQKDSYTMITLGKGDQSLPANDVYNNARHCTTTTTTTTAPLRLHEVALN